MSTAFLVSGGLAGISCGIIGLSFLGISFNLKSKQAMKQEKINAIIIEEPIHLPLKAAKRKRVKAAKTPELEISVVNDPCLEEPMQMTSKVHKRKKVRAAKQPNLEMSAIGLLEEEELKQKT